MYAGKGESVALPTTGHLHILKTGYVYWENDGKWDNAKKQTVDGRVSIGRLDPNNKYMLFPNKNYFSIFESVGLNQDDSKPALKESNALSKTLNYGAYVAMMKAADRVGCLSALKKHFRSIGLTYLQLHFTA